MSLSLGQACLGVFTFCGSTQAGDQCGSNGLPLTPNGIRILGQFAKLKAVHHPRLCKYIDLVGCKHERVIVVTENYRTSLADEIQSGKFQDSTQLVKLAFQITEGLNHLNKDNLVHRNLSQHNVLFTPKGDVKLNRYGLYHMTHCGADVSFPIGTPQYLPPETLAQGPVTLTDLCPRTDEPRRATQPPSGPKTDVWALGVLLLEVYWGIILWEDLSLPLKFHKILSFVKSDVHPLDLIARDYNKEESLKELPSDVLHLLKVCLTVSPSKRPLPSELLEHAAFREQKLNQLPYQNGLSMFSTKLRCQGLTLPVPEELNAEEDHLSERTLEEVYYWWRLAGGDLENLLKKVGLLRNSPPVTKISRFTSVEGEMFLEPKDHSTLLNNTTITLPLDQLRQRLKNIDPEAYYPLLEEESPHTAAPASTSMHTSASSGDLLETSKLPLIIKEKDVEYQFHRLILYSRLLEAYPYTKPRIIKEARIDIPPLVRDKVWAALLDITGDVHGRYDAIDKETPTTTDRQIEVDIPRCHQYNELLSSPAGHAKFKRILKAWVVSHPQYVYWQGLDSLCAPFLHLNFNNEAVAYACLSAFIPKYLNKFFLKDNSAVIQEYLAVFSHLIAFHHPELSNHLDGIGFVPELYAIPWFLTMFAHVFPLHKIFHVWDTLLLGNSSFPLYIGVAILQQLSEQLLAFGFNECILLFSDMPQIDMERVVQESVRLFRATPRSATYRQHAPADVMSGRQGSGETHGNTNTQLTMAPIPLSDQKRERCPRISAEDLIKLCELHINGGSTGSTGSPARRTKDRPPLVVIDIRPNEDYIRGTISGGINIPHSSAFTPEGSLVPSPAVATLASYKHQVKVILGGQGNGAVKFAESLLKLKYSKVCVLHKGIDSLKNTGYLTVPPAAEF